MSKIPHISWATHPHLMSPTRIISTCSVCLTLNFIVEPWNYGSRDACDCSTMILLPQQSSLIHSDLPEIDCTTVHPRPEIYCSVKLSARQPRAGVSAPFAPGCSACARCHRILHHGGCRPPCRRTTILSTHCLIVIDGRVLRVVPRTRRRRL